MSAKKSKAPAADVSPLAPKGFPKLPKVAGVRAAIGRAGYYKHARPDLLLIETMGRNEMWPALYTRFELGLLSELGYGLDLSICAVTGAVDDLAWVSPRSGRAASKEAGDPFADKLLRLPPFLIDAERPVESGDIADAFALAGYFLERRIFDPQGQGVPDARRRLIECLGFAGRL